MNNTPRTEAVVKMAVGPMREYAIIKHAQTLERELLKAQAERDEAREDLEFRRGLYKVQEEYLEEAREKAERYRLEANAMMLQRDESREALREITEASGFDNIGNWARNKAKSAIYR